VLGSLAGNGQVRTADGTKKLHGNLAKPFCNLKDVQMYAQLQDMNKDFCHRMLNIIYSKKYLKTILMSTVGRLVK
jgi:hypothetical protein